MLRVSGGAGVAHHSRVLMFVVETCFVAGARCHCLLMEKLWAPAALSMY